MDHRATRRRILKATGAGAAGLTGVLAGCMGRTDNTTTNQSANTTEPAPNNTTETDGDNTESREFPETGAVVIVYDDGPMKDYTEAFPVHRDYDMPATTGVVSNWVGDDGHMDADHLNELADEGWEIASHTAAHTTIASFPIVEDLSPDETTIAATSTRNGHHEGYPLLITDGENSVTREIVGFVDDEDVPDGRQIEVADPIGKSFSADQTEIRFPDHIFEQALEGSKQELESLGDFEVTSLLAPYDEYSGYSYVWVSDYYSGVANARPVSPRNEIPFNPFWTRRDYFAEYTTDSAIQEDLDWVAENDELGVFGAHAEKDEVSADDIQQLLEWIDDRGIEVLTLRDAIAQGGDADIGGAVNTTAAGDEPSTARSYP